MTQAPVARGRTTVPFVVPSRTPHGSILDYAEVIDDPLTLDPEGIIWSYNCIGIDVNPMDDCADFLTLTKRFDAPSTADGGSFVIQGGMRCKPFGFSGDDAGLKAAFDAMEPIGVSRGLEMTVFTGAVDINGGAAVVPTVALGLLESYAHVNYAGQPIIHLGPGMISQLASQNAITVSNGKISTLLGTPIAVSAGYETKTGDVLDPEQTAYVTGAVVLARSHLVLQHQLDRATNDITVLYERLYAAAIDCLVGKVQVQVVAP